MKHFLALIVGVAVALVPNTSPVSGQVAATVTLYEGARLITGEPGPSIDSSAFIVENDRFVRVGKKGELALPRGATRVDLTGKTVMPTLVELHAHLGYFKSNTERRPRTANFTREQLLNDLEQSAYYGVGAVLSLGADRRDISYQVRDDWRKTPPPNAARFFTAGQGFAAPNAGRRRLSEAVYSITTEAQARKGVQELAARKVDGWIKIWHDSRRGKMAPDVIRAIIDEAHKNKLRVAAHIHELADFKELLRMGIDGLAHPTWRQESVEPADEELIALLKQHPNVFMCTSFWTPRNQIYGARPYWMDEPILKETFSADEIRALENPNTPGCRGAGGGTRASQPEAAQGSGRAVRARHRHGRRRSGLLRAELAHRDGEPGEGGPDAGRGHHRGHAQLRADSRRREPGDDRARQERRFPGPRREPAREHREYATDQSRLPARPARRSRCPPRSRIRAAPCRISARRRLGAVA
jgi:hypothetical protein